MILDWSVIVAGQDGRCRIWKIAVIIFCLLLFIRNHLITDFLIYLQIIIPLLQFNNNLILLL